MVYQTIVPTGVTDIFMQKEIFIGKTSGQNGEKCKVYLDSFDGTSGVNCDLLYYVRG